MKRFRVPHAFVLVFSIIILMAIATWIIPAGEFDRVENKDGRQIVVAGSFHQIESKPQKITSIFLAPVKGLQESADIVIFLFIVGGAFALVHKSGAIDASLRWVVSKLKGREIIIIPVVMVLFSLGGAIFGMSEETIPFVMVFVPLALALGYDSIVGFSMALFAAELGFAGALTNPFTVGIAQGIAEIPIYSGLWYRLFCWFVITFIGVTYVMVYARKIKRNPEKSLVYEIDLEKKKDLVKYELEEIDFTHSHKLVILAFLFGIGVLIWGVLKLGWYIQELSALFLAIGIVCGILGRLKFDKMAEYFIGGASEICSAALAVGLARGILVIARDGRIIDTILNYLAGLVQGFPTMVSAWFMFLVQTVINFFIVSGSGQAALTMPIMTPLADLIGVSRQIAVLAYQFGDAFTNTSIPTCGALIGCLLIAKIPWSKWFRWVLPLQLIFIVVGCLLLSGAVLINYGP